MNLSIKNAIHTLKTHIKDFEARDIENTNEMLSGLFCIQLLVDSYDHPQKHLLVDRFCKGTNRVVDLKEEDSFPNQYTV